MPKLVLYRQEVQRTPEPPKGMLARLADFFRSSTQAPLTLKDPELARRLNLWNGGPTAAGVPVNEHTALNYSAVWAAVTVISSQIASLPLILYKRLPNGGKDRFNAHQTYRLLHDEFNPEMTAMVARETMQAHLLTWGNAYAEIERDVLGRPVALWPLLPNHVLPFRDERKQLLYEVAGASEPIPARDMLHIPGLGFDGLVGYSPIHMARESLALGMAAQRFGATFFGNGSTFGGAIEHPGELGDAAENLRESIEAFHQGPSKAHRFLILEEGMKYTKLGVDPNDAQFLETRQFEVSEVARWFNIPPHKLRDLMRATFSNIEQQSIEFVTDTLRPWMIRWEQEINRKLISRPERNIQYAEHLVEGLLRGDIQSRYGAYAVGRQWGWLSADDIRERENMNPLPDGQGKIYLVPLNMTPADRIGEVIDAQVRPPEPTPTPTPAADDVKANARHEALVAEIREGQRHVALLTDAMASQAQQVAALDAKLAEAATARAALAERLATSDGDIREHLEAEQKANAETTTSLKAMKASLESSLDAWRSEKETYERTIVEKQAEIVDLRASAAAKEAETAEAVQRAAAAQAEADAIRTAHGTEIERLAEGHTRELGEVVARATQEASTATTAAVERERQAAAAFIEASQAEHASALQAVADREAAERARIEDEARARESQIREEAEARVTAIQAQVAEALSAGRQQAERVTSLQAELVEAVARADATEVARTQVLREATGTASELTAQIEALSSELGNAQEALARITVEQETREAERREELAAQNEREMRQQSALTDAEGRTRDAIRREEDARAAQAEAERLRAEFEEARTAAERKAEEAAAGRVAAEQQLEAIRSGEAGRVGAILSAHRSLVVDTMRRMIEREADRARRSQATPQKLRTWMETFYEAHEDLCVNALLPAIRVHCAWLGTGKDALAVTREIARRHVEQSKAQLRSVLSEDPDDFTLALNTTLHRWEHDRAQEIADQLLQKEIDHARRTA